jgi:cyclopropane fatty-acyl-phospholipid synthase-like methyltransferase
VTQKASERLVWAVETLAVKPTDQLLEIGCGHGVAVSLVCEKLDGGHITAIDRSAKMIALASERNADCVAAGKATFQTAALHKADLGAAQFDKVFAIRVGVFMRGNPARELLVIQRCLAPNGRFHLIYDPVEGLDGVRLIEAAITSLETYGFSVHDVVTQAIAPTIVAGIIAGWP